jgi:hypothetical protein
MKFELSFSLQLAAHFTKIKEAPQSKDSQCTILKDDSFKESSYTSGAHEFIPVVSVVSVA